MAYVASGGQETVFTVKRWLGLNQNPGGDTKLKYGEASVMDNWRITRDGNLRRRPGTEEMAQLGSTAVRGLWSGRVAGRDCVLAACGGQLWELFDGADWTKKKLGPVEAENEVFCFGFDTRVWILDGRSYRVYDGESLQTVEGYRPLVVTASAPVGGGTALEQVNKLTGARRVRFSPDGTAVTFHLPERELAAVDYVTDRITGEPMTDFTANLTGGTVTFPAAPAAGADTLEIGYRVAEDDRLTVERMRFAELYNGSQDSRVFLCGDGSNQTLYSGLDEHGTPRADYFPDLNVMAVGESNTPVTAMIRHGSRLLVFKTDSTWSVYYNTLTLADGSVTAGFYLSPVNRSIGNAAPGQVRLVLNHPRTLHGRDCFEWRSNSGYLTADEREARRISDRVQTTLGLFDPGRCLCWDDNDRQEYYICCDGQALVHNYAVDAWYGYSAFDALAMTGFRGELYFGTSDGRILHLTDNCRTDCGRAIQAYWESGAMDFRANYMRKYTSMLWVSVKPESRSYVEITVRTDQKSDFAAKAIAKSVAGFGEMDFRAFSFITSSRPQTKRLRIKAKKYAYYKLIFFSNEFDTTATVLGAGIRVRQSGFKK